MPASTSASMPSASQTNALTLKDWFQSSCSSGSIPEVLLMDGGVSTHLEDMVAPKTFSNRSLWSSSLLLTEEGKDVIVQGHRHWLDAGCDVLTTVTYQCHYGISQFDAVTNGTESRSTTNGVTTSIAKTHIDIDSKKDFKTEVSPSKEKMREMMVDGIILAKRAIATAGADASTIAVSSQALGPFVVASTGPYGAAMADGSEYTGNYPPHVTRQVLVEFHTRKARTLLFEANPDGLAVETIPNIQEVGVVCEVLSDLQLHLQKSTKNKMSSIACWLSLACRNGKELNDGSTIEEALRIIQSYDPKGQWITAVGINCCDSAYIASLVTTLTREDIADRGIVIYPNSGEDWDAVNEDWTGGSGATDNEIADRLMGAVQLVKESFKKNGPIEEKLQGNSARSNRRPRIIIGGCCRTNPATIAMLRQRIYANQT